MLSCIIYLSYYLLKKKTVGILINYRLGLKLSLFQQFLITLKHQQIKWYQRLGIQYYKLNSMLGNVNRLTILACSHIFLNCIKNHVVYTKIYRTQNACFILFYSFFL